MAKKIKSAKIVKVVVVDKSDTTRDGDIFKILRVIKGVSNKEVALAAKVSPSTIRNWRIAPKDGGTRYPKHATMQKVLRSMNCQFVIQNKSTGDIVK